MTQPRIRFKRFKDLLRPTKGNEQKDTREFEETDFADRGRSTLPRVNHESTGSSEVPSDKSEPPLESSSNDEPTPALRDPSASSSLPDSESSSSSSSNSQLFNSINRLFSDTHERDPRFPSPPRHHSPDARPRVVPPLDPRVPYVRPVVFDPHSDDSSSSARSAHLILPMSSFLSDLTVALEAIELAPGEHRPIYGTQHSTPEDPDWRDLSGLWRPRATAPPNNSTESRTTSSRSAEGRSDDESAAHETKTTPDSRVEKRPSLETHEEEDEHARDSDPDRDSDEREREDIDSNQASVPSDEA